VESFSQHGEDVAILELIDPATSAFAVDVGANDGQSWSNSYLFGQRGYHLLLIEPMPEYARRCRELYAGAANVIVEEYAISPELGEATFFVNTDAATDELAMRSSLARELVPSTRVQSIVVKTIPLGVLLEKHGWPSSYAFLSVDAEGFDLEVLKSAALDRYRPSVICVEEGEAHPSIADYLSGFAYTFVKTLGPNGLYVSGAQA
jgi:FkbM family methyltransferase